MGFPPWTLWGMGLSGLGALAAVTLSFMALSPRFMNRIGLSGRRLELRIRALIGYALALMLLAFGFFLAGVPLDEAVNAGQSALPTTTIGANTEAGIADGVSSPPGDSIPTPTSLAETNASTRTTGAFGLPATEVAIPATGGSGPSAGATETGSALLPEGGIDSTSLPDQPEDAGVSPTSTLSSPPAESATSVPSATPVQTQTPTQTATPTPTMTPTPTATPTPTLTPTPIFGETAVIDTQGSTLWVRRSPGGQPVALLQDGDIVILSSGHANQGGVLWREVSTVQGEIGWVQEVFLGSAEE